MPLFLTIKQQQKTFEKKKKILTAREKPSVTDCHATLHLEVSKPVQVPAGRQKINEWKLGLK